MGWSYRKSFGSGPFKINFSNTGISYSVGVKGARINVGPRGTYVNLSSHGITYRKKISNSNNLSESNYQPSVLGNQSAHSIASAQIDSLSDTDSADFITELTKKERQISFVNWFGVLPLIIFIAGMAFTSFETKSVIIQPATDSVLVKVTSDIGANIRQAANAKASILRSATYGQTFRLQDSSNTKWLKVALPDTSGYISRRLSMVDNVHQNAITQNQTVIANPYAGYIFAVGLIGFGFGIVQLKKRDKERFAMKLYYDMDEQFQTVYQQFNAHFAVFQSSARVWQYLQSHRTHDLKRNAGAGQLIKRIPVRTITPNEFPLPYFMTNVSIPCIKLSVLTLYFLPERLLIKRGNTFASVFYKNLHIDGFISQFVESEDVPRDAKVVGHTWRYVNKRGGPDRRFKNNHQLPLCAYSQYTLTSDTGIYEVLCTSKQGVMDGFAGFIRQIGNLQSRIVIR